jgi:hypothetical protein
MNIPDGRARHVIVRINFCDFPAGGGGTHVGTDQMDRTAPSPSD